jgi:AcrR family transcriptional regulator
MTTSTDEKGDRAPDTPHAQGSGHSHHTSRGEAQRRALVDAAYHLIAEGGFERLRTRDVAGRAGVNIATLHYYFATKEDLIRAVVERVQHELSTMHSPSFRGGELTPLEELREEFVDVQYQLKKTPETYVVLFELSWRALRDPAMLQMLREMDVVWRRHIVSYLTEGVQRGYFRSDLDIPAVASGLVAVIKGGIMEMIIDPENYPAERVRTEIERWITGEAAPRE